MVEIEMEMVPSSLPILHRSLLPILSYISLCCDPTCLLSPPPKPPPHPPLSLYHHPTCLLSLALQPLPIPSYLPATIPTVSSPLHCSPPSPSSLISLLPSHSPPLHSPTAPSPPSLISLPPFHPPPLQIPSLSSPISMPPSHPPPLLHQIPLPILSYLPAAIPPACSSLHHGLLPSSLISSLPSHMHPLHNPPQPSLYPLLTPNCHPTGLLAPPPQAPPHPCLPPRYHPLPISCNRSSLTPSNLYSNSSAANSDHCMFLGHPPFPPPSSSSIACNTSSTKGEANGGGKRSKR